MKLLPTTPLNEALKLLSVGDHHAASILGLITRDHPARAIEYMRTMDRFGRYGNRIPSLFCGRFNSDLAQFLDYLTRKSRAK